MSLILGIDPGPSESGVVLLRDGAIAACGVLWSHEVFRQIRDAKAEGALIAIEMIASYGMPVGKEVFDTCVWIGQFEREAELHSLDLEPAVLKITRQEVKLHLCGSPRAKDANIRQRLIDLLGAPGTKKEPGGTYGVKSHAWAALAVAITARDRIAAKVLT